jgi:hypothetical protein
MKKAEQDYLNQLRVLQQAIVFTTDLLNENREVPASEALSAEEQREQNRACYTALKEAKHVMAELYKQAPIITDGQTDGANDDIPGGYDVPLLVRLADICSHTAHGLRFIATNSKPFACAMFYATDNHAGTVKQMTYDIEAHKESMLRLESMAKHLKGHGWKDFRKALLILAGVMLVAAGIIAAVPTGSISLAVVIGGVAVLTAGVGFFAGRDTGLAGAVADVNMKSLKKVMLLG